jgi:hypothetical protein
MLISDMPLEIILPGETLTGIITFLDATIKASRTRVFAFLVSAQVFGISEAFAIAAGFIAFMPPLV